MAEMKTKERTNTTAGGLQEGPAGGPVAVFSQPRLPWHPAIEERFGVDRGTWLALIDSVWPLAKTTDAVCLALAYCRARKLDPLKKPVHIVPMWSAVQNRMVETVWPSISELRTTAFRTAQYAGHDPAVYGPNQKETVGNVDMTYPEWCQMTVHRLIKGDVIRSFPGPRVYWREAYAQFKKDDPTPNSMWQKRPHGQIEKCAEAAALRAAFPEEIGNEYAAEEMEGRVIDGDGKPSPKPDGTPRPSKKSVQAEAEPRFDMTDATGVDMDLAFSPHEWAERLLADTEPDADGLFSNEALTILENNQEAADEIMPLMKNDQLLAELQVRYTLAGEQPMPGRAEGAGGEGQDGAPPAAQSTPATPSALPTADPPAGEAPSPAEPAGGTQIAPGAAPASPEPPKAQNAPAPQPEPAAPVKPLDLPVNNGKISGGEYLIMAQKRIMQAQTPAEVEAIQKAEGWIRDGQYEPNSNLAKVQKIVPNTPRSVDLIAYKRKGALQST